MAVGTPIWLVAPLWTTGNRPTFPTEGYIGFNITSGDYEGYDGATWLTLSGGGGGGGSVSDGDYGDIVVSSSGTVWTIDANVVSNAKFRTSAALSVVGRSVNSIGNVADISTSSGSNFVLLEVGGVLTWAKIDTANITAKAVTYAKIQDVASGVLLGNSTGAPASVEEITINPPLQLSAGALDVINASTINHGVVELATSGENAADVVVQGNDVRINYPYWPRTLTEDVTLPNNTSAVVAGPMDLSTFVLTLGSGTIFAII